MEKFNFVIANPPYNIGNKIIRAQVDQRTANDYIILMPFSKYKSGDLCKHVTSLTLADPKAFTDACLTGNLCVCKLTEEENNFKFEDLELETFNQDYREFYELNHKLPSTLPDVIMLRTVKGTDEKAYESVKNSLLQLWKDHNHIFYIPVRIVSSGVDNSDGNSFSVRWNIKKEWFGDVLPIVRTGGVTAASCSFLKFKTEKECANFCSFYYAGGKQGLMHKLIMGLNKMGGFFYPAFPNIDWSVDRDYEHLTYEQLLDILREQLVRENVQKHV